jgi:hypothetical protein
MFPVGIDPSLAVAVTVKISGTPKLIDALVLLMVSATEVSEGGAGGSEVRVPTIGRMVAKFVGAD